MSILDRVVVITQQYWPDLLLDCVIVKIWQLETPTIVISVLVTDIIQEAAAPTHISNLSLDMRSLTCDSGVSVEVSALPAGGARCG